MLFFLLDAQGRTIGPYRREELRLFLARGMIESDTILADAESGERRTVGHVLAEPPALARDSIRSLSGTAASRAAAGPDAGDGAASAAGDFLRLAPHLMLPIEDLLRLRWLDNRRILALAMVGLIPLFLLLYLETTQNLGGSIWGVALYSSLLWALYFYVTFSQPEVTVFRCVLAYLGSAIFSIGLVALARFFIPLEFVTVWITSQNLGTRWAGHFVGVALIEEPAKLFMLYFLLTRRAHPPAMMFYGLMAGLGFGIYEGVAYQSSQNLRISFPEGRLTVEGAAIYYMLNILRLTSLPFLHAMWTGIAGYFVGFAAQYPSRRGGLLLAAVLVPSLLHATYNAFSNSAVGLTVAVVTVLALNLYLAKGRDFERVLAGSSK